MHAFSRRRRELLHNQVSPENVPGNDEQPFLLIAVYDLILFNGLSYIDEETKAQSVYVTCSRLQIEQVAEPGLELRSVWPPTSRYLNITLSLKHKESNCLYFSLKDSLFNSSKVERERRARLSCRQWFQLITKQMADLVMTRSGISCLPQCDVKLILPHWLGIRFATNNIENNRFYLGVILDYIEKDSRLSI